MVVEKTARVTLSLLKRISFIYQMEWKTFIEAICNNNVHTEEKLFFKCYISRCGCHVSLLFRQSKQTCIYFGVYVSSLLS